MAAPTKQTARRNRPIGSFDRRLEQLSYADLVEYIALLRAGHQQTLIELESLKARIAHRDANLENINVSESESEAESEASDYSVQPRS